MLSSKRKLNALVMEFAGSRGHPPYQLWLTEIAFLRNVFTFWQKSTISGICSLRGMRNYVFFLDFNRHPSPPHRWKSLERDVSSPGEAGGRSGVDQGTKLSKFEILQISIECHDFFDFPWFFSTADKFLQPRINLYVKKCRIQAKLEEQGSTPKQTRRKSNY